MVIKDGYIKRPLGLILYDLDGTITYHDTIKKHYIEVLELLGIEPEKEYIDEIITNVANFLEEVNKGNSFSLEFFYMYNEERLSFLRSLGISGREFSRKGKEIEGKYLKLYFGMDILIRYMAGIGFNQAIFTNWFREIQVNKLKKYRLLEYFNNLYTPESLAPKPSVDGFKSILELEQVAPENVVMIGDSSDDLAAKKAGIQTILFDPNQNKEYLYNQADSIVTEPLDIKRLLLK